MMNLLDEETRTRLLKELANRDQALADNIRQRMFVFEDLVKIDARSAQLLAKEVPINVLALALKNAAVEVRRFVMGSLSSRNQKILEEEIQNLGPRRISEIEAAQAEVIKTAKKLQTEGKITIPG